MSCDVFISYSQGDKKAAEDMCRILEQNGIGCWIAPRNISPGSTWANSIVRGIESCRAMLLICSSNTNASRQMSRELQLADERRLPIVPARLSPVEMTGEYSYYLNNTQWLDLFPGAIEDHNSQLVTAVRNMIGNEHAAATAVGAGVQPSALVPQSADSFRPVPLPSAAPQKNRTLILAGGGVILALLAGVGIWKFTGSPLRMPAVLITGAAKHPNGFWVSTGPVTVGEFKKFLLKQVRGKMPLAPDSNPGWANENAPMVNMTKRQADEFCKSVGGHLPESTEMQPAVLKTSLRSDTSIWEVQEFGGLIKVAGSVIEVHNGQRPLPAPDVGFRCLTEVVP